MCFCGRRVLVGYIGHQSAAPAAVGKLLVSRIVGQMSDAGSRLARGKGGFRADCREPLFYRIMEGSPVTRPRDACLLLPSLSVHAQELAIKPAEWMPWNYRETLERIGPLADSA
jgi:hypothetical protein